MRNNIVASNINILSYSIFFAVYLICPNQAYSQSEEEDSASFSQPIQEFFLSEAVYPQEQWELQITPGIRYTDFSSTSLTQFFTTLEFGLTDRIQIETELSYFSTGANYTLGEGRPGAGFSGIEVGVLYNPINTQKHALSIALGAGLAATDDEQEEGTEWEAALIYARQFGNWQAHLNLGTEWSAEDTQWVYNLGIVYPMKKLNPTLELSSLQRETNEWYVTPGAVMVTGELFQFGLGVPLGLTSSTPSWGLVFSLTLELQFNKETD